jgi:hypothetical protein
MMTSRVAPRQRPGTMALAKITSNSTRAEEDRDAEDAEREAEVADAVDDEGLDRGGVGDGFLYQKPISR